MTILKTLSLTTLVVAGTAVAADAQPFGAPPLPPASMQTNVAARNGYGQLPYGLYGQRRRFRADRSYGTGYRGRGTRTGGPSGGLPGRS